MNDPVNRLVLAGISFPPVNPLMLPNGKQLWVLSLPSEWDAFKAWGLLCDDFHTTFIPATPGALILLVAERG